MKKRIIQDVTVVCGTHGNVRALAQMLSTVACGTSLPAAVKVRLDASVSGLSDFYLSQVSSLFAVCDVKFNVEVCQSNGVRALRQWQLSASDTDWALFLDDDVVVDHKALELLRWAAVACPAAIYIQGSKPDVNNIRGYGNFSAEHLPPSSPVRNFNCFYEDPSNQPEPVYFCDTGHVLVNVKLAKKKGLTFAHCASHTGCGGEDTLFALQCEHLKLPRFWCPAAIAVHLEKPVTRYSEHAYRKEAVLRTAESLGYPTDRLEDEFLSWERIYTFAD